VASGCAAAYTDRGAACEGDSGAEVGVDDLARGHSCRGQMAPWAGTECRHRPGCGRRPSWKAQMARLARPGDCWQAMRLAKLAG
jgi:hypothetical protein